MSLREAMEFRENIHFFKQDEYPTKKEIEDLIKDAHELVPHKNNMIGCNITIWGPEYFKEKEKLVLSTMCGRGRERWRKGGVNESDYTLLKEVYDKWRKSQMRPRVMIEKSPYPLMQFNEQVRAPYLLVYTQRLRRPTESQLKRGFPDKLFTYTKSDDKSLKWYISAAMHGISLAYLAGDRKISASFCKCYSWSDHNPTEILRPAKEGQRNIAFMIGLGYADKNGYYPKQTNYGEIDEYVKWK